MKIRQVASVARDLDAVVSDICEVLGIEVSFNDPGVGEFGLVNAVMPIGDTFLEIVSPSQEGTTAGRLLEKRGGDGAYMVLVQTEDLDVERRRMKDLGVRVVWSSNHDDACTMHLHPKDVGCAIVSLDTANPPDSWRWAGPEWPQKVKTDRVSQIIGVEVQAADPEAGARKWADVFGKDVSEDEDGRFKIPLDSGAIYFENIEDGRGDGVTGFILKATDSVAALDTARKLGLQTGDDFFVSCGTRFRLVD